MSEKPREPEVTREKVRERTRFDEKEKEPPKKVEDKAKQSIDCEKDRKPKQRTSNGGDYEKKREYQVKITEQKISFRETVRGKQQEPRETKISISSSSTPSRTPSPFLKPHERKDFVPATKVEVQPKATQRVTKENVKREVSEGSDEETNNSKLKQSSSVDHKKNSRKAEIVEKTLRKVDKKKSDETESRKRPAQDASDVESVTSKKRKKKNRDGSISDDSDKKKKRSKLKKHKKSSKKSKKKDRSVSRSKSSASEEESNVNEDLEKKLRQKALVSLMRKNKKTH